MEKETLLGMSVEELVELVLELQDENYYLHDEVRDYIYQNDVLDDEVRDAEDEITILEEEVIMLRDELLALQDELAERE